MVQTENIVKSPFTSKDLNIFQFFTDDGDIGKEYNIPIFQRFYSWRDTQVAELLTDIHNSMKDDMEEGLWIGNILLAEHGRSKADSSVDIVDGQQRIVTISLIIKYLSTVIRSREIRDDVRNCLWTKINNGKQHIKRPRINIHNEKEQEDYLEIIENKRFDNIHEDNSFSEACDTIKKYFEDEPKIRKKYILFLLRSVFLVTVSTKHNRSINRVFETLNNRGTPLKQIDLFRNMVLGFDTGNATKYYKKFYTCYTKLGENNKIFERYFLIQSQIRCGYILEEINKGEKKKIKNTPSNWYRCWKILIEDKRKKNKLLQYLENIFKDISKDLDCYQACLFMQDTKYWKRYWGDRYFSDCIHMMGTFMSREAFHPLLFTLLCRVKDINDPNTKKRMKKDLYDSIRTLYVFMVRVILIKGLGGNTDDIAKMIVPLAHEVYKQRGGYLSSKIFGELYMHDNEYSDLMKDNIFRDLLRRDRYCKENKNGKPNNTNPRFCLDTIVFAEQEELYSSNKDIMSVEHIVPYKGFDPQKFPKFKLNHDKYKGMLGNMTLVTKDQNSKKLGSKSFADKKVIYADSVLRITRSLCDFRDWGPREVRQRQDYYIEKLMKILSFPSSCHRK